MHPAVIQAALKMRGVTQVEVANQCGVGPSLVHDVIHGNRRSHNVEKQIAVLTGLPLVELWPERYGPNAVRSRRRVIRPEALDRLRVLAG
jgi:lambda repressor-like predicted transcriptional regulator